MRDSSYYWEFKDYLSFKHFHGVKRAYRRNGRIYGHTDFINYNGHELRRFEWSY